MAFQYYFDFKSLTDEDLQSLYGETFKLGRQAVYLFRKNYERNSEKLYVRFRYVRDDRHFNAHAIPHQDKYEVGISVPTIYLIRTLFDSLLLAPEVLPTVRRGTGKGAKKHYTVQFLKDVLDIQDYKRTKITADLDRLLVSSLLTDFCSAFVVLHEIGHIVLGHTDYKSASFGKQVMSSFYGMGTSYQQHAPVFQAQEYDADVLAAKLLSQYIYNFVQDIPSNPDYNRLLKSLQPEEHLLESITALVLEGVLCMFVYLAHAEYEIEKRHDHPYPLVRIKYIRDFIGKLMEENYGLDVKLTNEYINRYNNQFVFPLFSTKLLPFPKHQILSRQAVSRRVKKLREQAIAFRPLTTPYTWVPVTEWT